MSVNFKTRSLLLLPLLMCRQAMYIEMNDRQINTKYKSNLAETTE